MRVRFMTFDARMAMGWIYWLRAYRRKIAAAKIVDGDII
jgi:hypothetical protein